MARKLTMFRAFGGLMAIVLVLAAMSGPAAAQRPAAWDTRVRSSPPPQQPAEQQDQTAVPKDKPVKPVDTAGSGKSGKPKAN
jgi:hypothetical protein